jgi:hypothetical protein
MAEIFVLDFQPGAFYIEREFVWNLLAFSGTGISNIEHSLLYSITTVDIEANRCNSGNGGMYSAICVVCNLSS